MDADLLTRRYDLFTREIAHMEEDAYARGSVSCALAEGKGDPSDLSPFPAGHPLSLSWIEGWRSALEQLA